MKWSIGIVLITVVSVFGCTTASRKALPPVPIEAQPMDETAPSDEVLGQYQTGVDSAAALYDFGDVEDFVAARDSLRHNIEALLASQPSMRSLPQFQSILRSLSEFDSLLNRRGFAPPMQVDDSLALAIEDWPEIEDTKPKPSGPTFGDTVFPEMTNERIDFWLRYFTGPGKERFGRALYRMELNRPVVEKILDELELPHELIVLPIIESSYVMKARSRARAVGPWQFIPGTARIYGLRVNWWFDERRDIVASTYAAGNYLSDLHGIWSSWPLALAAYNCGEYRVARAVASHKTQDFWKLRLPKQTERYVPKFLAALYIVRDPGRYGFVIPDVEPVKFDDVTIKDATDLKLIAESADCSVDVLRDLNPGLLRWSTPPKMEVSVKVPEGSGELCLAKLAAIPPSERVTWRKHKIRKGQTLSVIARKYGTTITALKSLNGIRNAHKIRQGRHLIVPMQGVYTEVASSKPQYKNKRRNISKEAMDKYAKRYAAPANHKKTTCLVKSGDTLGEIAEVYHTSAKKIRRWNNLRYRSYIYPGQKLTIYVPNSFDLGDVTSTTAVKPDPDNFVRQTYKVKKGDTFYGISKRFNVRMVDLLAWNGKSRRSTIYPGQKLEVWTEK